MKLQKLKILQVIDALQAGGAERVFVDLSNMLSERRFQVSVLVLTEPGALDQDIHQTIPRHYLHRKNKWSLKSLYTCAKIISQFDIVHCHHYYVYAYVNLASKLFFSSTSIILHDHSGTIDINENVPFKIRGMFKPLNYIGVSESLIQWAKERLHMKREHIHLLPNIIRKQPIDASTKTYNWICVGNIKPVKNQLFAIKLAKEMNQSLLLVGQVQDREYYELLKKESIGAQIEFLTSCIHVHPYIAGSKFGICTSLSESGPLVLVEYLAYGIPFITFNTGEVAHQLKSELPHSVANSFDKNEWIQKINLIHSDPSLYHPDSLSKLFSKYYNEDQYIETCLQIYQKSLACS